MKRLLSFTCLLFCVLILVFLMSCSTDEELQMDTSIRINNNLAELSGRMVSKHDTLDISGPSGGRVQRDFELVLEKEVEVPTIDGQQLQATAITNKGKNLLVSYNYAGSTYLGGIDFLNDDLELLANVLYTDADVHSLTISGNYLYAVGAAQEEAPAFVERIQIKNNTLTLDENLRVALGSYAATSVSESGGDLYVTTGNDESDGGGVYRLNKDLDVLNYQALHDSRWSAVSEDQLYILQGTPGQVTITDTKFSGVSSFTFPGANESEAKSTLDIADDRIFIAGGKAGIFVHDLVSGELLHTITFEGEEMVANAVTAEDGLIFISNGRGVHVASYDKKSIAEEPVLLGQVEFNEEVSANHVLYRAGKMYVATGLGGVKVVKVVK